MRTLLFAGSGGAGTTTLATAAALGFAAAGRSTVLLTRRPAAPDLAEVTGLRVVAVEPRAAVEDFWRAALGPLRAAVPELDLPPAGAVAPLPGAAQLALLTQLARLDGGVAVVDAGSLDDAVDLVGLPGALTWWLDQVLPPRLRALAALRTAAVGSGAMAPGPVDAALAVLPGLQQLLERTALADPARTSPILVARPGRGAAEALRTATTALAVHGQRPAGVLARVLPAEAGRGWWATRRAEQQAALATLDVVAPVTAVPESAAAPATVPELSVLLPGFDPAPVAGPRPAGPERADGGWQLVLPLPFAERGAVEAARHGDALLLTAAGARRSLPLDSLLRRCQVSGAQLVDPGTADACLELRFVPDPRLWPADLLAAEGRVS